MCFETLKKVHIPFVGERVGSVVIRGWIDMQLEFFVFKSGIMMHFGDLI
jgi:hypothetical protein